MGTALTMDLTLTRPIKVSVSIQVYISLMWRSSVCKLHDQMKHSSTRLLTLCPIEPVHTEELGGSGGKTYLGQALWYNQPLMDSLCLEV